MNRKGINFNQENEKREKKLPTNWKHKLEAQSKKLNKNETWINRKYLNQKFWEKID